MSKNILLENALRYATELNWHVFPTREVESAPFEDKNGKIRTLRAKAPYRMGGLNIATTDRNQILDWWRKTPQAGIGINCGKSKLVVIDIDTKNGRVGFDNWMKISLSDAEALHAMTPSGGMHVVYSGLVHTRANSAAGIDVRSIGGYIVASPSVLYYRSGEEIGRYTAVDDWFTKKPPPFPSRLMERLDGLKGKHSGNLKGKPRKKYSETELMARVRKALNVMPIERCDQYNDWIVVGLALKNEFGDKGYPMWVEWSKKSAKFDLDACEYRWEKFEPRDVTIGTIFYWAYDDSGVK